MHSLQAKRPLRFGVLGAANINKEAIVGPTKKLPTDAVITALSARDPARARKYRRRRRHGVRQV